MAQPSIFWWQKYGTLAQMAQAAVALLGFVAILFQINEIRSNNRARQRAAGVSRLHRSGVQESEILAPDYDAIKAGSRDEQVQYESFVSYFLYACEEAIAAFADRPRMAGLLRLRPEAASAVPVREEQRRAGLSRDLQHRHPAMGEGVPEDRQRHTTRLQARKDLRQ